MMTTCACAGGEALGGGEVDRQGAEVAVVDAEEGAAHMDGTLELALVVDLDQHRHPQAARHLVQSGEPGVIQAGGDQQDDVRAMSPSLDHLVVLHHEVLAEHRDPHPLTHGVEIGQ